MGRPKRTFRFLKCVQVINKLKCRYFFQSISKSNFQTIPMRGDFSYHLPVRWLAKSFTLIFRFFGCFRYSFGLERREENSRAYGQGILSYLTRLTRTQPQAASFVAYFRPDIPIILFLICCPAHLKHEVIQDLEKGDFTFADGNSLEDMIPGEDKAFVFLSGGIRPFDEEDLKRNYLW